MEKKMGIVWNVSKLAKLADSLRMESPSYTQIGAGRGYLTAPKLINVNGCGYSVTAVCSYASAMGVKILDLVTGTSAVILCEENHSMTAATASQMGRLARDLCGVRFNLYDTRAGYSVSMGDYSRDGRGLFADPYLRNSDGDEKKAKKAWKEDAENGYTEFLSRFAPIFDEVNATLKSWYRVTD